MDNLLQSSARVPHLAQVIFTRQMLHNVSPQFREQAVHARSATAQNPARGFRVAGKLAFVMPEAQLESVKRLDRTVMQITPNALAFVLDLLEVVAGGAQFRGDVFLPQPGADLRERQRPHEHRYGGAHDERDARAVSGRFLLEERRCEKRHEPFVRRKLEDEVCLEVRIEAGSPGQGALAVDVEPGVGGRRAAGEQFKVHFTRCSAEEIFNEQGRHDVAEDHAALMRFGFARALGFRGRRRGAVGVDARRSRIEHGCEHGEALRRAAADFRRQPPPIHQRDLVVLQSSLRRAEDRRVADQLRSQQGRLSGH
jgi:hypothetical protein